MDKKEERKKEEEKKKSKTSSKRKRSKIDDGVMFSSSKKRNVKGIVLALTKPCYVLKRGIARCTLRWEHRKKLLYLMRQLVRRQNWVEASAVLSLLFKVTRNDYGLLTTRTKFWATLELLQHMKAADLYSTTAKKVYFIWLNKDSFASKKYKRSLKSKFDVLVELLLFFLTQDDADGVRQAVSSIKQKTDFSKEPTANLVVGLAFSHLWYNAIKKDVCLHDSLESGSPIQSATQEIMLTGRSNGQIAAGIQGHGSAIQTDSNTSVPVEADHEVKKELPDQNGNSLPLMHTCNKVYDYIVFAHDVEYLLMPITFPRTKNYEDLQSLQNRIKNDHYEDAVKHLLKALHSTPPAFEALLPLIQMLVLGDQVEEAITQVGSVVKNSHAALPFRLKASLLEHFSKEDANKLPICFEETLYKDPTCSHSLAKLINLHHVGDYNIESLVEMIALHLDATYANYDIWKEFASCFIMLSQCDEVSSCVNSYGDSCTKFSKNIPEMFQNNISRKNWRLRCRWWRTRYFTQTILASEITSGQLELVVYKAASACHLYGPEFAYVVAAYRYLIEGKRSKISILQKHIENAIGIHKT